jgi:hypothetical protein
LYFLNSPAVKQLSQTTNCEYFSSELFICKRKGIVFALLAF